MALAIVWAVPKDAGTGRERESWAAAFRGVGKALKVPWGMAMARDRGYECGTGTETVPAWQRRILASMTWPMFNLITGAAREDAVVDDHFARVFNMDESLAEMMTSPRVLAGLLRYKINTALGRLKQPFGFDALQEPPGTDWTPDAAPGARAGSDE